MARAESTTTGIIGTGRYLPSEIYDNAAAAADAGVTDEWILRRTGIRERRVAGATEGTAVMGTRAATAALASAELESDAVELIIVATSTPDHLTPPTACEVQAAIGAHAAACFDIEAGFAGWIYALITADGLLRAGVASTALVVGVEKLSTVTDRTDPATGPLFGDGAGAVVLRASAGRHRIRARSWWADGRLAEALIRRGGGAKRPFDARVLEERTHLLRMEGTRLFRQAVRTMAEQADRALASAGIGLDDVGLIVPHQANRRILDAFAREMRLPEDRVFVNIDRYGNTGAATVPIALDEATEAGRAQADVTEAERAPADATEPHRAPAAAPILLVSFGAGATAGAVVVG